jgi:iron complex transport system permease protein
VWFAFAGAALAGVVVYLLGSTGRGGATPVRLALAGAALLGALTSAVLLLDVQTLDQFRLWVVGSLAGRDADVVAGAAPFLAPGVVLAPLSARSLNTLALGDAVARSLGQWGYLARGLAALSIVVLCGTL